MAGRITNKEIQTIRKELESIKGDVGRLGRIGIGLDKFGQFAKHSDWSAHADWSSSSKMLEGTLSLSTSIGIADSEKQLDTIIRDASSDKFLAVAKNLKQIIK